MEFLKSIKYFSMERVFHDINKKKTTTTIKRETYANIFCGYDIEVSSFQKEQLALPYIQMIGIGSQTIYTRNIEDSIRLLEHIAHRVKKETGGKLLVLVHNLSYEWQHIKRLLSNVVKVFARSTRDVIEIVTDCLVFRCTYAFTRLSLAKIAENFTDVKKAVGDLKYDLERTPNTRLTFREFFYCFYDIEVLRRYYKMEYYPNWISKRNLPLTSTGKVRVAMRKALRKWCKENGYPVSKYHYYIVDLQLDKRKYQMAKRCFYGAYTHADVRCTDQIIEVDSFDFGSSYPYCILCCEYPVTPFKWVIPNPEYVETHACMMEIEVFGVTPKTYHHPLSFHKMLEISGELTDNGRIISAEYIKLCVTEIDWKLINQCYKIKSYNITTMMVAEKGKLPDFLRKEMMYWYTSKNELKGVKGKEVEYLNRKEYLNAIYGMLVQDLLLNNIYFDDFMVLKEKPLENIERALKEVQEHFNRFYAYQWGVYVIAWSRYNLFNDIIFPIENTGAKCVYCDTDSGKSEAAYDVAHVFDTINARIENNVKTELKNLGIDPELSADLGQVCKENKKPFLMKTLGAKRYCVRGNNEQHITVSGMKNDWYQQYIRYLGVDMFDNFTDGLSIPAEWTGKLTMHYREDVSRETLVDYQGNAWTGNVYSGIFAEKQPYSMNLEPRYAILISKERRGKTFLG